MRAKGHDIKLTVNGKDHPIDAITVDFGNDDEADQLDSLRYALGDKAKRMAIDATIAFNATNTAFKRLNNAVEATTRRMSYFTAALGKAAQRFNPFGTRITMNFRAKSMRQLAPGKFEMEDVAASTGDAFSARGGGTYVIPRSASRSARREHKQRAQAQNRQQRGLKGWHWETIE